MRGVCHVVKKTGRVQLYVDASLFEDVVAGGFIATNGEMGVFAFPNFTAPTVLNSSQAEMHIMWQALRLANDEGWAERRLTVHCDNKDAIYLAKMWAYRASQKYVERYDPQTAQDIKNWGRRVSYQWVPRATFQMQKAADQLAKAGLHWGRGTYTDHNVRVALDSIEQRFR